MASRTEIDFYFDYGSPASYIAYCRLPAIADRAVAEIEYKPILLGGLLKAVGNSAPTEIPEGRRFFEYLGRWAAKHEIRFQRNPFFRMVTLHLMRGAIAARRDGRLDEYSDAFFSGDLGGRSLLAIRSRLQTSSNRTVRCQGHLFDLRGSFGKERTGGRLLDKRPLVRVGKGPSDRVWTGSSLIGRPRHFPRPRLPWLMK